MPASTSPGSPVPAPALPAPPTPSPGQGANRRNGRMLKFLIFAVGGALVIFGSLFFVVFAKRPEVNARAGQVKQSAKQAVAQIPLLDKQRGAENSGFYAARAARESPTALATPSRATPPPTEMAVSQAAPTIPAAMSATVRRVSNRVTHATPSPVRRGVVPGFQVIPCRLVGALESGSAALSYAGGSSSGRGSNGSDESGSQSTSIKAFVDEDVRAWDTHEIVIPKNTQCNAVGHFRQGRDRVFVETDFTFVMPGRGASRTPLELVLPGIAQDREYNAQVDSWSVTDLSDGIRGDYIQTNNWQEVWLFANKLLSGASSALAATSPGSLGQTYGNGATSAATGLRGYAVNPAIGGAQSVLDLEAARILDRVQADGYFMRVPAGKQFYVLVPRGYSLADALPSGQAQALREKHEDDRLRQRDERISRARAAETGAYGGYNTSGLNASYRPTFTDPNVAALLRQPTGLDASGTLRRPVAPSVPISGSIIEPPSSNDAPNDPDTLPVP